MDIDMMANVSRF